MNKMEKWREDLIIDIRYHDSRDDDDHHVGQFPDIPLKGVFCTHPTDNYFISMSPCNMKSLKDYFYLIKNKAKCILEIGVDSNCVKTEMSSTNVFLNNKNKDTYYFGLDIEDKSYLNDEKNNVFTIKEDASNIDNVMNIIRSRGIEKIDFLFIDGWHSINQVMREWEYTRWLSDFAIVGFHDTAIHPGPYKFLKALNRKKWKVIENACNVENDYGIGFVWEINYDLKK